MMGGEMENTLLVINHNYIHFQEVDGSELDDLGEVCWYYGCQC